MKKVDKEEFFEGYKAAALWSSTNADNEPLDDGNYEMAQETADKMREDCEDFIEANEADLELYLESFTAAYAGHDFWLTRNRHGVGFWDRGLKELGERLSEAAKVYGSADLYVGDDFKVYQT